MKHGMLSAPQPEAVDAGLEILEAGGNAVDAAIGAALVQTAVDPLMCGIAGFGSMQLYLPGYDTHLCFDFHGRAPLSVTPDMWEDLIVSETEDGFGFILEGRVNEVGYGAITSPMSLKAFDEVVRRFGTRNLAELLAPAIGYCEDGFLVRPHVNHFWTQEEEAGRAPYSVRLTGSSTARRIYVKPDGRVYGIGERIRNPDMAATYRGIAAAGADDFYNGRLAEVIVADMAVNGGYLGRADLTQTEVDSKQPLEGSYRGCRIATNHPPGGGVMLLEILNILENFDLASLGHNSVDYIAVVAEAMKIATVDKDAKVGDPRFVDVPLEELTSKDYAAAMAARIKRGEVTPVPRLNLGGPESRHTTHVSAVDHAGNCVALTHSLGMPAGVITEGLGFMYNGCMQVFDPRPGRANSLAPGKSRFSAMAPTIVFRDGAPLLVVGAPGGTYITMGVLQTILNVVDFGMRAQEAVEAPRFSATSEVIEVCNRVRGKTEQALQRRGYATRRSALSYDFAGVYGLRQVDGCWDGGADPARDGMVASA